MTTITMCLIAKDESARIERCFDSWWNDVDEVVLVDTGSSDDTVAVAERYAAEHGDPDLQKLKIGHFDWVGDFAKARQAADDFATSEWVTWADLDDEVRGMGELRKMAESAEPTVVAYLCHYVYARDEAGNTVSELWRERLVRRRLFPWTGRLHEHKLIEHGQVIQVSPDLADWIHHHDPEANRGPRNLAILEDWLEEEPENPRILSSIGLEHTGAGNAEAAIPIYERYLKCPGESADKRAQATRYLCAMLMTLDRVEQAEEHAWRALREMWGWTDTHLTLAEIAQRKLEPQLGFEHAARAEQMGKPNSLLILNPVQYTAHAKAIMAICAAHMGRYDESLKLGQEVLAIVPGYHIVAPFMDSWQALLRGERTVASFTATAQLLIEQSELEKAQKLLEQAPYYCQDDPRIIQARIGVRDALYNLKPPERPAVFELFLKQQQGRWRALDGAVSEKQVARQLAKGGRTGQLFVCAPDGANGPAPRAYRSVDLASMLQRHGRFTHFAPTDDGHVIAGITPVKRRGEIAIWTGYAIGSWHPTDIVSRGLGGSETAAYRLAEELDKMGYAVTLYGQFEESGLVGNVMLRDFRVFDPTRRLDGFVGFRDAQRFLSPINAKTCCMWLEDVPGNEGLTPQSAPNIDYVCCVSRWHRDAFRDFYPWMNPEKVIACRNGITLEFFDGPAPDRAKRLLFTSSPDRGLEVLLALWPRIREQVPDAELVSTYSRWYDIVAEQFPKATEHREEVKALLDGMEGARRIEGGMGQADLAHLMRASLVWAHPSWYTAGDERFCETSCISAMEAQRAGLVVVASKWGALTETVQVGELIDGDPRIEGPWRDRFVDEIVRGLTDESRQLAAQTAGPEAVRDCDWRGAAEQLAAIIERKHTPSTSRREITWA